MHSLRVYGVRPRRVTSAFVTLALGLPITNAVRWHAVALEANKAGALQASTDLALIVLEQERSLDHVGVMSHVGMCTSVAVRGARTGRVAGRGWVEV